MRPRIIGTGQFTVQRKVGHLISISEDEWYEVLPTNDHRDAGHADPEAGDSLMPATKGPANETSMVRVTIVSGRCKCDIGLRPLEQGEIPRDTPGVKIEKPRRL